MEQFVEQIFPSQDPKQLSLQHKGEVSPEDAKKKAAESESNKDTFFLLLAVVGTLFVISAMMVRNSHEAFPISYGS